MTGLFDGCTSLTSLSPFINWKQCNLNLINSSIKALDVHNIIIRSMNLSDGAVERKLILNETTKDEWTNSEYYSIDNDLLSIKGIIIE
jgi:hypothetical protein